MKPILVLLTVLAFSPTSHAVELREGFYRDAREVFANIKHKHENLADEDCVRKAILEHPDHPVLVAAGAKVAWLEVKPGAEEELKREDAPAGFMIVGHYLNAEKTLHEMTVGFCTLKK